jgi:hypothetical protein
MLSICFFSNSVSGGRNAEGIFVVYCSIGLVLDGSGVLVLVEIADIVLLVVAHLQVSHGFVLGFHGLATDLLTHLVD